MAKTKDGAVEITLGGETYSMVPSMDAKKAVNRQFGGLKAASDRVQALDIEAIALVICLGAGVPRGRHGDVVDAAYEEADLAALVGPVAEYLGTVIAFGKAKAGNA